MYYGIYPCFMRQCICSDTQKDSCDHRITVNGKGKVTAVPDQASVVLGVVTEGSDVKHIQQKNAEKMSQIINTLKRMGIGEKDIQTNSYIINKIYDYVDNKQVFKGYRVTNTIKVDIKDIQKAGEIIDAVVSSGANLVEDIDFTLSDQSSYYRESLSLAVKNAVENAKAIEKTLNILLDEMPVSITEEVKSFVPMAVKGSLSAYESVTPIKPGLMDIEANVKVVFSYREV